MVHALEEIRRVLRPQGTLVDLRPLAGNWPVEVVSGRSVQEAGRVSDLAAGLEDDAAANRTMARAAEQNWFRRESEEFFPFHYYWDSPSEMKLYIDEEWEDFIRIGDDVWKSARTLWTLGGAETRLRVRLNMLITRWQKVD